MEEEEIYSTIEQEINKQEKMEEEEKETKADLRREKK